MLNYECHTFVSNLHQSFRIMLLFINMENYTKYYCLFFFDKI